MRPRTRAWQPACVPLSGPLRFAMLLLAAVVLAGCASTPATTPSDGAPAAKPGGSPSPSPSPSTPTSTSTPSGRGGYYLDDGPGLRTPQEIAALAALPDPVPADEPLHPRANRPYRVLGNDYQPMTRRVPFVQQGIASWYGRKFHGQLTSIGEPYDMYGMTAAHPTLPLPSYARVTSLENGRSVVVRINDRGPFLHGRAIDLSYLAAHKLGYVENGSARVQVELLDPLGTTLAGTGRSPVGAQLVNTGHAVPAKAASVAATGPAALPASGPGHGDPAQASPIGSAAAAASALEATPAPQSLSAPVSATVPAAAPAASATSGANAALPAAPAHYLQLGAFGSASNADAALASLRRQLEWLQVPIDSKPVGGLYRVQAGPYALREQAVRAAEEVATRTGLRPLLLPR